MRQINFEVLWDETCCDDLILAAAVFIAHWQTRGASLSGVSFRP